MSQFDKVLSNIIEYRNLLLFLKQDYPKILEEWKTKKVGPLSQLEDQTTEPVFSGRRFRYNNEI